MLTPREIKVLELFASGRSHEEIAGLIFDPDNMIKGKLRRLVRLEQIMVKAVKKAIFYSNFFERHHGCKGDLNGKETSK